MNYDCKRVSFMMECRNQSENLWWEIFTLDGYGILAIPDKISQQLGEKIQQFALGTEMKQIVHSLRTKAPSICRRQYSHQKGFLNWKVIDCRIDRNCVVYPYI